MKYDGRLIGALNESLYFPEVLQEERGDRIGSSDYNVKCIYHTDSDPSMRVYKGEGRHAYCFTCGKTYTPYHALKYLLGLNFFEIMEYAQTNYGFVVPHDLSSFEAASLPNKEMANIIKELRKVSNPKILTATGKAIAIDSKAGNADALNHIYKILFKDCI